MTGREGKEQRPPAIFLMGPTASGKTDLALRLAEAFPLEIICVDSAVVYRGLDIGTAKPGPGERARGRHHLLAILDPEEPYSAGRFREDALVAMAAIRGRGRIPLLTGGTMLYFRAIAEGIAPMPPADAEVRAALDREATERGLAALHAELRAVDPEAADRIHPNDPQRIQRALEVYRITGRPISAFQGEQSGAPPGDRILQLAVAPGDRERLHARIAERFDAMLAAGLTDEVAALRGRPALHADLPSMRAVGYRQVWQYLDGELDAPGMRERGIIATRQLAKRQLTWLRGMRDVQWFDSEPDPFPAIRAAVARFTDREAIE
ncbi:MAG: tRNA (adenosine(37)-N6)-dimethylallyltransferase MiaA [Halofilum sp. (in: g-proteobacteria)]